MCTFGQSCLKPSSVQNCLETYFSPTMMTEEERKQEILIDENQNIGSSSAQYYLILSSLFKVAFDRDREVKMSFIEKLIFIFLTFSYFTFKHYDQKQRVM